MKNNQSEVGYHATTSVTTQVSTQNVYRLNHSLVLPVL